MCGYGVRQENIGEQKKLNTSARKRAFYDFVELVEDRDTCKAFGAVVKVLNPLRIYLWQWDWDNVDTTTILAATEKKRNDLENVLEELRSSGAITASDMTAVLRTVDARVHGSVSNKVKVTLLNDMHYLAACLTPDTSPDRFADIIPKALRAFRRVLVNFPGLFSADELATTTPEERTAYFQKELMIFVGGSTSSILVGRAACKDVCDLRGFWKIYGKEISILRRVGEWISFLSASSCLLNLEGYSHS